jgi:CCR4-NOT complex subunit CAF16
VQQLIDIMQIDVTWRINAISDGQRRRCQLLECLAQERSIYILDEITTDLDLFAREGLLEFLRRESLEKGATIVYATHIFDYLAHWATHVVFFSQAKVARCCAMSELTEYHEMVRQGVQCPLYSLMRQWVSKDYDHVMEVDVLAGTAPVPEPAGPTLETKNLTYAYAGGSPQLRNVSFAFGRGARILVIGANGAGKSTLLSILGGKRMIRRGLAEVLGRDCFNDSVGNDIMYCGDWWRTKFFMNLRLCELLGEDRCTSARVQHLAGVLQINLDWNINAISDGQRRRCQLLDILSVPRPVYLMDEITSDLDLFAREGILSFLKAECDVRGATVFYCTHIFDHLEGWASHMLRLSKGEVLRCCPMEDVAEYKQLVAGGDPTPLYSLVRGWVYAEYDGDQGAKPWRKSAKSMDARLPNLGLAGPMVMHCSG